MIRQRKLKSGLKSLVYDSRSIGGNPKSLGLRLIANPRTAIDREMNRETMALAKKKVIKLQNEISKPEIYTEQELAVLAEAQRGKIPFTQFCKGLITDKTFDVYNTAVLYFSQFRPETLCEDLTIDLLTRFREYILKAKKLHCQGTISKTSASVYLSAIKSMALKFNPKLDVEGINPGETMREGLSIAQLRSLAATECKYPLLKRNKFIQCFDRP